MTKTIFVKNNKDRNYNGVAPYQVTEIPADQLDEYLAAGFADVDEIEREYRKSLEKTASDEPTDPTNDIKARIKFLKDHNINVGANRKEATIIAKSDEAGYVVSNDPDKDPKQ